LTDEGTRKGVDGIRKSSLLEGKGVGREKATVCYRKLGKTKEEGGKEKEERRALYKS
jgi:hypothetical protein